MKKNETIFDFVGNIFLVFGFTVTCLNIFCILFGESAQEYSTMFELGNKGLTKETMMQFLLLSVVIVTLRYLFFTDILIKNVSLVIRTISMFGLVIIVMVIFVFLFGWFPYDMWETWAMFLICFGLSAGISMLMTASKEKWENKKMEEALQRLKQGENE